jgi:hypothetical protein
MRLRIGLRGVCSAEIAPLGRFQTTWLSLGNARPSRKRSLTRGAQAELEPPVVALRDEGQGPATIPG